jgi:hypothetical protein
MTQEEDDQWATGAFGTGINVIMIFVGLGAAFIVVNAVVDIGIRTIGNKYLP